MSPCPGTGVAILHPRIARYNGTANRERGSHAAARHHTQEKLLAEDKLYKAEYLGSGTFVISKPKRKRAKMRQTQLRNPQRGSRK